MTPGTDWIDQARAAGRTLRRRRACADRRRAGAAAERAAHGARLPLVPALPGRGRAPRRAAGGDRGARRRARPRPRPRCAPFAEAGRPAPADAGARRPRDRRRRRAGPAAGRSQRIEIA